MQLTISKDELYTMMKSAVRDVIREERIDFILHSIPEVSDEEMKDIVTLYGEAPKPKTVARTETLDI